MDINALFDKDGMRDFTSEQRDTFMNDGQQIRQMQRIVQARLAQITLDGDRPGAAGRRARKMAKKFGKLAGLLEKAAAQCEAINTAYVHDILELPDRRLKALEAKETRRQRLGIASNATQDAIAQSLTKSAGAFHGTPVGNPQVTPAADGPRYVDPMPYQFPGATSHTDPLPAIGDLFDQEAM
jgi:hypothetical protein